MRRLCRSLYRRRLISPGAPVPRPMRILCAGHGGGCFEAGRKYGRQYYDYNCGTRSAGIRTLHMHGTSGLPACGRLHSTPICSRAAYTGETAEEYTSCAPQEALPRILRRRRILTSCFDDLRRELRHGADRYTRAILTRHIIRLRHAFSP